MIILLIYLMFVAMAMKHLFLTATIKLLHPHFAIAMMLLEYSVKRVIICNFCLNNGVSLIGLLDNTKGPFNCTDGDVKLFGGSNPYKGTLHICVNKAWSTVCWRNNWQSVNTAVVCHQLGYTAYGTVTLSPPYFPLSFSFSCFPLFFSYLSTFCCHNLLYSIYYKGNFYSLGRTDERYPAIIAGLSCQGTEKTIGSCNRAPNVDLQYCSLEVVEIQCQGNSNIMVACKFQHQTQNNID